MAGLQARSPIITREDFLLKTTPIPNVTCTGTNLAILLIRAHLADRMHPCSHLFACPCFPHLPAYFVRPSAPDHVRWSWWGFGAGHGDWRGSALGRWPVNVIGRRPGRRPRFGSQPVEHCPRSTSVCHGSIAEMLASWQFTLGYWNSTRQVGSWRHQLPQSWREEMEGASRRMFQRTTGALSFATFRRSGWYGNDELLWHSFSTFLRGQCIMSYNDLFKKEKTYHLCKMK